MLLLDIEYADAQRTGNHALKRYVEEYAKREASNNIAFIGRLRPEYLRHDHSEISFCAPEIIQASLTSASSR